MLAIAIAAGGCAVRQETRSEALADAAQEMTATAERVVFDQERLPLLRAAIDGLKADLSAFDDVMAQATDEIHVLNARADVTREEMEAVLDRFEARREQARLQAIRRHFELIALTDADEWSALAPYERRLVLAAGRKP